MKDYGYRVVARSLREEEVRLPPSVGLSLAFALSIAMWAVILWIVA